MLLSKKKGVFCFSLFGNTVLCVCVSLSNIFTSALNLTVNQLPKDKRNEIIEFHYQNGSSVKKVHCGHLPFYVLMLQKIKFLDLLGFFLLIFNFMI